jgi:fermentation-respiration switch protein FrsA (DUF1100 family)
VHVPSWLAWVLIALAAYLIASYAANRQAFSPSKYPEGSWNLQSRLGAQDVWLNARGARIHSWWIPHADRPWVTLFLHGKAGNLTDRIPHYLEIAAAGCAVLALDYRGYGKSDGRPSEGGLSLDAEAAYDHLLQSGYQAGRIILHGESLGTAVAVALAARRPCAAVVLEAPFTSAREVAATILPFLGPALVWGFDSRARIRRIRAPLLILHGDRDATIPLRLSQSLLAAAPDPKSFWLVPHAGHNDIVETAGPDYRARLASFYAQLPEPAGESRRMR